jgi:signal transduction histidine kinase
MLNTIIRNLISNAIKFTKRNGTIKISSSRIEDIVEVSVADNGIGMNEETRQKLFRIDMTQSSFGTENEAGTGLGLILCKEFVEKNSGQIRVESTPDVGTTFYFTMIKSSQ